MEVSQSCNLQIGLIDSCYTEIFVHASWPQDNLTALDNAEQSRCQLCVALITQHLYELGVKGHQLNTHGEHPGKEI